MNDPMLLKAGFLDLQSVQAVTGRSKPLNATEMFRIAIRQMSKSKVGRRGLPREVVKRMYMDYLRLGSLRQVGKLYNRTRQSMWQVFRNHHLRLNPPLQGSARIVFDGVAWAPDTNGYFRPTTGDRSRRLHHALWEKANGKKIPEGWQVTFKNGDNSDFRTSNLVCMPIDEVTLHHWARKYPERAGLTREQRRELSLARGREYEREKRVRFVAMGLRCDGLPRRRPDWRAVA